MHEPQEIVSFTCFVIVPLLFAHSMSGKVVHSCKHILKIQLIKLGRIRHTWTAWAKTQRDLAISFSSRSCEYILQAGPEQVSLSNSWQNAVTKGIIPSKRYSRASPKVTFSAMEISKSLVILSHLRMLMWDVASILRVIRILFSSLSIVEMWVNNPAQYSMCVQNSLYTVIIEEMHWFFWQQLINGNCLIKQKLQV